MNKHLSISTDALDNVVNIEENKIITRKRILNSDPVFRGHFPGYPIYPGVYIIEMVNQASQKYFCDFVVESGTLKLVEVVSVRFLYPVSPDDILECDCQISHTGENNLNVNVKAVCLTGNHKAAILKLNYRWERIISGN
jgi:3-hydroxyacyl-[acyl-carrier-protein] dehydratase